MTKRRRPTYSDVMATVAVFLALGGTSWAVARGSIGTRELKDGAVTSGKVRDGSLQPGDLASGVLSGARGPRGAQGPAGPTGAPGPSGPVGPSDVYHAFRDGAVSVTDAPEFRDVIVLDNLPAGDYWVYGVTDAVWTPASGKSYFRCKLVLGPNEASDVAAAVGTSAGASEVAVISHSGYVRLEATGTVRLRCGHDAPLPGGGSPRFEGSRLTAIRTSNLVVRPVAG